MQVWEKGEGVAVFCNEGLHRGPIGAAALAARCGAEDPHMWLRTMATHSPTIWERCLLALEHSRHSRALDTLAIQTL